MPAKLPSLAISDAEALTVLLELLAIPGRSGQEQLVMEFLTDRLRQAGVSEAAITFDTAHKKSPHGGQVGNLIMKLPGTLKGARRMLSAHVDTVPICVGAKPVKRGGLIVSADKNTGLGGDDRAGAAVVLLTLLELVRSERPYPPLTLLWTVQEEVGLFGARHVALAKLGKPMWAANFDGGSPAKITLGATGGYRMTIDITGLAAHAGNAPEHGISAITIASLAIADIQREGWHGRVERDGQHGTSNVGVIVGGEATNVVTDKVRLKVEARSHNAEFRQRIVSEIEAAFTRATQEVRSASGAVGSVAFDGRLDYEAFRLPDDAPCVQAASAAVAGCGLTPELYVTNGGLDANWLTRHGVPTVTLGCGQRNIHTVSEQLDIAEFQVARRVALELATKN